MLNADPSEISSQSIRAVVQFPVPDFCIAHDQSDLVGASSRLIDKERWDR
jgi:hypothetical protein